MFALIIAGIPGAILIPFALAGLISTYLPRGEVVDLVSGGLAIVTVASLIPSIIAMVALLIVAILTAVRKPIDPDSPTPKTQQSQIVLSVLAAATAAAEFIYIFLNSFTADMPCTQIDPDNYVCPESDNFLFPLPGSYFALASYLVLWLAITTIWLKNKKPKTTA